MFTKTYANASASTHLATMHTLYNFTLPNTRRQFVASLYFLDFVHIFLELLLKLLCINKPSPKSKLVNVKKNLHEEMLKKTR